jgi:hypothetical protein
MFTCVNGSLVDAAVIAGAACAGVAFAAVGGWPRSRRPFPTTMRVPPVPRVWGPGMEDSHFTVLAFTIGVSSWCMKGERRVAHPKLFGLLAFPRMRMPHPSLLSGEGWESTSLDRRAITAHSSLPSTALPPLPAMDSIPATPVSHGSWRHGEADFPRRLPATNKPIHSFPRNAIFLTVLPPVNPSTQSRIPARAAHSKSKKL